MGQGGAVGKMNVKVEVLPIEQGATPDPSNVNKHTQKGGTQLENSLRKRGAFRSIASAGKGTETPVVYAGNYTLEKAVDAGFTEIVNVHVRGDQLVNVVRDDIAPGTAEAVALGIEDNEIGKQSYNPDIDVLAALAAGNNAVLSALRASDKVFGGLLDGMGLKEESQDAPAEVDRAAELLEKWQVVAGDLWQIGDHRLICGDCTDAATVARVMGGERAAVCFTSPPYNAGKYTLTGNVQMEDKSSRYKGQSDDRPEQEYIDLLRDFTDRALEVCELVCVNIQQLANNKHAVLKWVSIYADRFVDRAIWCKGAGNPAFAPSVMDSRFEDIWIFSPNERPKRTITTGDFRGTVPNVVHSTGASSENESPATHAATMPMAVCEYAVKSWTKEDAIIYDPFCGSGTTLLACENLGRRGRAVEISPAYVAVALERMSVAFPLLDIRKL